ncbi:MAG TPA: hypothetical protein VMV93_04775 [Chloroflexota bacterium]|nr:hypothetical protein [Chloroflexota bacterium]
MESAGKHKPSGERELLAGIAINGPWRGFVREAQNPKKRHYGWGYSMRGDLSDEVIESLKSSDKGRRIKNGTRVYLAYWDPGKDATATIFRMGYVDYIRRDGHFISFAFHLDEMVDLRVPVGSDQVLLRYVDASAVTPAEPAPSL